MKPRRVVVSGVGVVSALGPDRRSFWRALTAGRSGIGPIPGLEGRRLAFRNGAVALTFEPPRYFDRPSLDKLDRFAQLGVAAARDAAADAAVEWTDALRERTAVVMASAVGGQTTQDDGFDALYRRGRNRVHPLTVPRVMANAACSRIGLELGLTGPSFTLSTACASSSHALGLAFWMVRQGVCDLALAGGSEAPFSFGHLKAWEALRVVSPDTCRPFSRDRAGLILGEGGAVLVLEPLTSARRRGARILAEIAGFGMSADAHHLTRPSPAGAARALRAALDDACLPPEAIDYINAHGTATAANDPAESRALEAIFGPRVGNLPVSSTKSMHGHALGAAGALEATATVLALANGVIPPTANFTEADPDCDLDAVPNCAREAPLRAALSSSFAFGGLNAVLAFRRCDG